MAESWTCRHFSQANPEGPGQDDVPALLRRVAKSVEELGAVNVHDVTFHTEVTPDGNWHSMTVYFTEPADEDNPRLTTGRLLQAVPSEAPL